MKKQFLLLFLAAIGKFAYADESSPAQSLRKDFVNSCVSRAIDRKDDAASAATFCTCAFDIVAKELTVAEYIEFDQSVREKRRIDTLPASTRIKTKLAQCKG